MCTYMKNMAGYKMEHFKGKSFYEIKEMFDKVYKQVTSFVPMDSVMEKRKELKELRLIFKREYKETKDLKKVKYPIIDWEVYFEDIRREALWVELKRLFEPDNDESYGELQSIMHDPFRMEDYVTCGVNHVSFRGYPVREIYSSVSALISSTSMLLSERAYECSDC
ncbi:hypothetical protein Tco_1105620 [Tanacetum coccineum]